MTEYPPAFGLRTHWCGELRPEHAGQTVSVCGWVARRREHGEHLAFMDLRDREGVVQCVIDGSVDVRSEWVVRVTGVVRVRPEGTVNPELASGEVELGECEVEVLNTAEPPPFPVAERVDTDETVRLRHRYVDLRRDRMQRNLRAAGHGQQRHPSVDGGAGLRRDRDADAHRVDARGRPRLRGPVAPAPGQLLRPAAEPAAVQAAHDGRRHRPLLPDRPLPARRGPAGRPPVRVHAARRRGQLRRPGRGAGLRVGRDPRLRRRRGGGRGRRHPADDVARGHGALRVRQARHPLRHGAGRADRGVRGHRVQGVHGPDGEGHPRPGRRRAVAQAARRPDRQGQALGRQGPGVDAGAARGPRQPRGQVPVRGRVGGDPVGARRRGGRSACCSWPTIGPSSATCSACCGSSSDAPR